MSNQEDRLKTLIGHAKEYGFVFPSSEIYDGLSATYDYGPYGAELKNNIRRYWWEAMTKLNENIVGIDAAIFMHPTVWKASGHVDAFNDPLIDNKDSKKRYRADVLLEEHMAKYADKIEKETEKAKKKFGDAFDEAQFRATNPNVTAQPGAHRRGGRADEGRPRSERPGSRAPADHRRGDQVPGERHGQLDRSAPVQPDVRHRARQRERREQHDLPASRNAHRASS
jgi:hypothetical protein